MIHQGNGLIDTGALDKAFIQFSCAANETSTDNLFTTRLLQTIIQEDVNVVDLFQGIAEDVCLERHKSRLPFSISGSSQNESIFRDQVIPRAYLTVRVLYNY